MQSPFEVLEWNSASKEQDLLIDQLFGDTCTSNRFQPNGDHEGSEFLHINVSKKGKRKALVNDEDIEKAKKKKKEKRERNKFKRDLKLTSQLEQNGLEDEESKLTDKNVKKSERKPKGKRVKNKFKRDEQFNSQLLKCKSQQYGSVIDESIVESKSFNSVKDVEENTGFNNKDKTKQVASIDSALLSSADAKAKILKSSSCEPAEHKRKKDKKKKKIDKRKSDHASSKNDDCDVSNMEQTEANHMHIGRPQTNGDEKDSSKTKLDSIWITKKRINTDQDEASPSFPNNQSSLHEKMSKQLESSRFRWINEQLYTTTGDEAAAMFSKDPGLFDVYHRGFTNQVKLWPVNPVDKIIQWLRKRCIVQCI